MPSNFQPWSSVEDRILRALRANLTNAQIAQVFTDLEFQRTAEGIRKRSRALGIRYVGKGQPNLKKLPNGWEEAVAEALEHRENTLFPSPPLPRRPLTSAEKAKTTSAKTNSFLTLFDELSDLRNETPRRSDQEPAELEPDNLSMCVLLSDFHIGRIVDSPEGERTFDIDIASARLDGLFAEIMSQTSASPAQIDEVVLLLAGDIVDGEGIYPGQEMELDTHLPGQTKLAVRKLWNLITQLAEVFPTVRVVTVRGNHGRTNGSADANWDTMVYQALELLVDISPDLENVTISNRYGLYNTFEVRGWKGLLRHQAPAQAETPSAMRTIGGWHSIHEFDFVSFGHYHHWGINTWNSKLLFRNGALYGADDYAESFGARDYPHQLVWTVSYEKPLVNLWPIRFD